ncbi:hypothetical protein ABEB36_015819 [Hypothenemus hampei]|uniref:Uncharacterized protein n=1 Tax=Hypothenemus hampei TaxID=57062 RepID=A0ABD1DYP1_HYPHA
MALVSYSSSSIENETIESKKEVNKNVQRNRRPFLNEDNWRKNIQKTQREQGKFHKGVKRFQDRSRKFNDPKKRHLKIFNSDSEPQNYDITNQSNSYYTMFNNLNLKPKLANYSFSEESISSIEDTTCVGKRGIRKSKLT